MPYQVCHWSFRQADLIVEICDSMGFYDQFTIKQTIEDIKQETGKSVPSSSVGRALQVMVKEGTLRLVHRMPNVYEWTMKGNRPPVELQSNLSDNDSVVRE